MGLIQEVKKSFANKRKSKMTAILDPTIFWHNKCWFFDKTFEVTERETAEEYAILLFVKRIAFFFLSDIHKLRQNVKKASFCNSFTDDSNA